MVITKNYNSDNNFGQYRLGQKPDGTYEILRYSGEDISPVIPQFHNGVPVTGIAHMAFSGSKICFLEIPEGIKEIDEYAFCDCQELMSITISSTVSKIHEYAFNGCENVEEVFVNQNNKHYTSPLNSCCIIRGNTLFFASKNCTIPEGVEKIRRYCFYHSHIKHIKLPSTLKEIGLCAFMGSDIEEITIPKSVELIKDGAFEATLHLKKVIFEKDCPIRDIPAVCFSHSGLKKIVLPDYLRTIGYKAFDGCNNLSMEIPPTVDDIREQNDVKYADLKVPINLLIFQRWRHPLSSSLSNQIGHIQASRTIFMNEDCTIDFNLEDRRIRISLNDKGIYRNIVDLETGETVFYSKNNLPPQVLNFMKTYNDALIAFYERIQGAVDNNEIDFKGINIDNLIQNPLMQRPARIIAFALVKELVKTKECGKIRDKLLDYLVLDQITKLIEMSIKVEYPECTSILLDYKARKYGFGGGSGGIEIL